MKTFLFVMQELPYQGVQLQEKLDVILTTAAFDQKVALLFLDGGVFQLKGGQQPEAQHLKDTLSIFNVLEMYDVNDIFIETESMQERGLKLSELSLPAKEISRKYVNGLMQRYDITI